MTSSSEITLTYTPYMVYRLFMKRSYIMDIIAVSLLFLLVFLLAMAEFYLKAMAKQLERLEIENESLKTKLEKFTGGKDDQA